jgi:hypothetical protein
VHGGVVASMCVDDPMEEEPEEHGEPDKGG